MKKFVLIFALCLIFLFAGCSSDKPTGELLPESKVSDDDIVDTDTDTNDEDSGDTDTDTNDDDSGNTDTGDTDTGDTDTDTDTGNTDTGDTDTGDTDTGDTDTGNTDTGDTELTEEEKCTAASGIWNDVSKECLQPVLGRICTNQKKCYNFDDGTYTAKEINCSGSDFPGQDPYFAALGKCIPQEFNVQSPAYDEPVVIDTMTGLVWEQSYSPGKYSWKNAGNYCTALNESNSANGYAGITDWRVPTVQELLTIVDNGRTDPAFDEMVFPNMQELYGNRLVLWTSQDMNDGSGYDFLLDGGENLYIEKTRELSVVCVSGGKMPKASFDVQENVVIDETTGLVWQRGYASGKIWVQALEYCKSLGLEKYADYDDWRLPNKNELASLLDLDKNNSPYSAFPDMPGKYFWSSSTWADYPVRAWYADFSKGLMGTTPKDDESLYVLCVR